MNKIIQIGLYVDPEIPLLCVHHREPLLNYILDFILFVGDCTEGFLKQNIGRLKFPSSDDFGFVLHHSHFCAEKILPPQFLLVVQLFLGFDLLITSLTSS